MRIHDLGYLFIHGLIYGLIFYKTKSIETSILLHSFSNLAVILFKSEFRTFTGTNLLEYLTIMITSIVIIYLIFRYINRINKISEDYPKKVQAESLNEGI